MKDIWIKFGCFLTGHNYAIIKNSSEASAKTVKKYLSALLIISTIWGFIGFAFTQRYLHGNALVSSIGALVMIFIIIQIERQIILSLRRNLFAMIFRILIGVVMAIIGSVILDQVIFKEDVEKEKITNIQKEVNKIMPEKTLELSNQIQQLDSEIVKKESERTALLLEVSKKPMISAPTSINEYKRDSVTKKLILVGKQVSIQNTLNPKTELIPQVDKILKNLREQKIKKENDKLNIQQLLENDIKSKVGFLNELKTLFDILLSSPIAMFVWILLFMFFFMIELFIIINKWGDKENDYDKTILHQMDVRIKMLDKLSEKE
ncbi:MAG: DUF4407 domain-containing protein [Paludibacter sp.]|jgi:hypothetical protein|nr:DUF4407 domain-containing protein [Paludibacter sp.]